MFANETKTAANNQQDVRTTAIMPVADDCGDSFKSAHAPVGYPIDIAQLSGERKFVVPTQEAH